MTANEFAQQLTNQGIVNVEISRGRSDLLWKLAQQSGQAETAGTRTARGTLADSRAWTLSFYKGVGYFQVK